MAAEKPITNLLADMPENWTNNQIVSSDGTSVGLTEQHGYNHLMKKVNETVKAVNDINDAFSKLTTDKELQTLGSLVKSMYLLMHPVGSIVFNTTRVNPGVVFGGTWVEWGKGKVPVGVDVNDGDFNTVEKTGGKKEQALRASIGAVSTNMSTIGYAATAATPNHSVYNGTIWGNNGDTQTPRPATHATEVWQDNGQGPTTLQPYITCYMWKRTS